MILIKTEDHGSHGGHEDHGSHGGHGDHGSHGGHGDHGATKAMIMGI